MPTLPFEGLSLCSISLSHSSSSSPFFSLLFSSHSPITQACHFIDSLSFYLCHYYLTIISSQLSTSLFTEHEFLSILSTHVFILDCVSSLCLFFSALCCAVLCCAALFCSVLFCNASLISLLFCSDLFCSVLSSPSLLSLICSQLFYPLLVSNFFSSLLFFVRNPGAKEGGCMLQLGTAVRTFASVLSNCNRYC